MNRRNAHFHHLRVTHHRSDIWHSASTSSAEAAHHTGQTGQVGHTARSWWSLASASVIVRGAGLVPLLLGLRKGSFHVGIRSVKLETPLVSIYRGAVVSERELRVSFISYMYRHLHAK